MVSFPNKVLVYKKHYVTRAREHRQSLTYIIFLYPFLTKGPGPGPSPRPVLARWRMAVCWDKTDNKWTHKKTTFFWQSRPHWRRCCHELRRFSGRSLRHGSARGAVDRRGGSTSTPGRPCWQSGVPIESKAAGTSLRPATQLRFNSLLSQMWSSAF